MRRPVVVRGHRPRLVDGLWDVSELAWPCLRLGRDVHRDAERKRKGKLEVVGRETSDGLRATRADERLVTQAPETVNNLHKATDVAGGEEIMKPS